MPCERRNMIYKLNRIHIHFFIFCGAKIRTSILSTTAGNNFLMNKIGPYHPGETTNCFLVSTALTMSRAHSLAVIILIGLDCWEDTPSHVIVSNSHV